MSVKVIYFILPATDSTKPDAPADENKDTAKTEEKPAS
jgi:hypothetical protein